VRIAALAIATLVLALAACGSARRTAPAPIFVRTCETSVRGELARNWRSESLNVGPISFLGLPAWADATRSELAESPQKKVLAIVRGGATVTVSVARQARGYVSLAYDPALFDASPGVRDGDPAVRFRACREETQFNGAFLVEGRRCVAVEIRWDGRRERRVASFGRRRCG
jgi:ribosomal protein L39E